MFVAPPSGPQFDARSDLLPRTKKSPSRTAPQSDSDADTYHGHRCEQRSRDTPSFGRGAVVPLVSDPTYNGHNRHHEGAEQAPQAANHPPPHDGTDRCDAYD